MTPTALLILTYVCDYESELDAEALADLAIPRPRLTSPAAYLAWRSGVAADRRAAREQVVRDLRELVRQGLVAPCQDARLAERVAEQIQDAADAYRADWRHLMRFVDRNRAPTKAEALALGVEMVVRSAAPHDSPEFGAAVAIIRRLLKGPMPVKRLIGRSPSGATKRAWAMVCDAGLAVPPSRRVPTDAGRHLVAEVRARGAA